MLGMTHTLSRWLMDDTTEQAKQRIFCVHTQAPEFIGEIRRTDTIDSSDGSLLLHSPLGYTLCRIRSRDAIGEVDLFELTLSFSEALEDYFQRIKRLEGRVTVI